ncbi:MAG: ABC transporter ATP-binding protein [Kiritimatiellae bacterium]|nr:ABC transporter ATP-binding protein [Kiritimatiellia bacterium]
MPVLEVQNVAKSYRLPGQKAIPVLEDVSLSVGLGEHVAIVGRSGAGKTTLLNILGGLDRPTSGDVLVEGVSLFKGSFAAYRRNRIRAAKIGFVFQSFHLMPELDIVENVLLPAMTGAVKLPAPRSRAKELLAKVGLGDRLMHLPGELSGGEQQRVALARALMCNPRIVFADEPTGNLDKLTGAEIMKLLFEVSDTPFALVMVTHSQEAAALCDRVLTLDHGRLSRKEKSS